MKEERKKSGLDPIEGGVSLIVLDCLARPMLLKGVLYLWVLVGAGVVEGGAALVVLKIEIGALGEEQLDHFLVTLLHGNMKRSVAVLVHQVNRAAAVQEALHTADVVPPRLAVN